MDVGLCNFPLFNFLPTLPDLDLSAILALLIPGIPDLGIDIDISCPLN